MATHLKKIRRSSGLKKTQLHNSNTQLHNSNSNTSTIAHITTYYRTNKFRLTSTFRPPSVTYIKNGVCTARQIARRAYCPTHDLISPVLIFGAVLLFHMAILIQRAHMSVSLYITCALSQPVTKSCMSPWSVVADLCSTFGERFRFFRVRCLVVIVSNHLANSEDSVPEERHR